VQKITGLTTRFRAFLDQRTPFRNNSNPHNSGPEVDIDTVPTAFFIVRQRPPDAIIKGRQMAPQVPELEKLPLPQNFKTPYLENVTNDPLLVLGHGKNCILPGLVSFVNVCRVTETQR